VEKLRGPHETPSSSARAPHQLLLHGKTKPSAPKVLPSSIFIRSRAHGCESACYQPEAQGNPPQTPTPISRKPVAQSPSNGHQSSRPGKPDRFFETPTVKENLRFSGSRARPHSAHGGRLTRVRTPLHSPQPRILGLRRSKRFRNPREFRARLPGPRKSCPLAPRPHHPRILVPPPRPGASNPSDSPPLSEHHGIVLLEVHAASAAFQITGTEMWSWIASHWPFV